MNTGVARPRPAALAMLPLAMLLLALLAGCNPLRSSGPPPVLYLLTGPEGDETAPPEPLAHLPELLSLSRPEVPAGLDGDGIGVIREGRRLDYVAGARWAEPLPGLLQRSFSRTLEAALGIRVMAAGTAAHQLAVRVDAFHPAYARTTDRAPELEVALTVTLVDAQSGVPQATGRGRRASWASENRLGVIIAELDALLHQAFMEALAALDRALAEDGRRAQCDHGACTPSSTSR
jgi:ABC-type uncharacterized transport system auxiliary subunit